jgi:hypothetical protein
VVSLKLSKKDHNQKKEKKNIANQIKRMTEDLHLAQGDEKRAVMEQNEAEKNPDVAVDGDSA